MRSSYITLVLAGLFTSLSFTSFAQSDLVDVIYLKNGSIIRGIVVEQVPGQAVKLQTGDGNLFVFETDEIMKMTREAAKSAQPAPSTSNVESPRDEWGRTYRQNKDIADGSRTKGIAFLSTGGGLMVAGATLVTIGYVLRSSLTRNQHVTYLTVGYVAGAASVPFFAIGGSMWAKHLKYRKRAESMSNGSQNTDGILSFYRTTRIGPSHTGASVCDRLTIGHFDDWYLPALNELERLYHQRMAVGGFGGDIYQSSTEQGRQDFYGVDFRPGRRLVNNFHKDNNDFNIRCIRRQVF